MIILTIYHDQDANVFYDEDGQIIYDIFEIITPSDLYLYRHDNQYDQFPLVYDPEVTIEIIKF